MRITVHRRTDQIGGCVTEYESNGWKLFVDSGEQFSFGEFKIMPIVIDHSAFDAHAFRVEAKNLKVFYTGDIRTHGFRSGKLPQVIEKYVGKVDYVVCEATNVNRPDDYNPRLAQSIGTGYEYLHTSGHCDMASLKGLLDMLQPKAIIPIHADNPRRVADLFCDKWPVILLEDGESFAAICDPGFDTTTAKVMAFQEPDNSCEVIENTENLQWWMVDNRYLGEFPCWNDADSALRHVVYAPKRLLGYAIEADEDMAPFLYVVYNPDFTEHSRYGEGGHNPEDECYQSYCEYTPRQRVLANIDDVLVPCEVVGPLTEDFLRKEYINEFGALKEEDSQEYKSELWDWDWDKVVVRPLVKINTEYGEISSETAVQRIYIFPYKTL